MVLLTRTLLAALVLVVAPNEGHALAQTTGSESSPHVDEQDPQRIASRQTRADALFQRVFYLRDDLLASDCRTPAVDSLGGQIIIVRELLVYAARP